MAERKEADLDEALHEADRAGHRDPDEAEIAADDAGGTRAAEALAEEEQEERGRRE